MLQYDDDGKLLIRVEVITISTDHIKHADRLSVDIRSDAMSWYEKQPKLYVGCEFVRFEIGTHRTYDNLFEQIRMGYFFVYPHVAHQYFYRPDILEPQRDGTIRVRGHVHPSDLIAFYLDYKREHPNS